MQILESFGLTVTEVCCHKLNMNTKEKDIIKRILNSISMKSSELKPCHCGLLIRRHSGIGGVAEFSQSDGDISGSPQVASKSSLWDYSWCIIPCMKTDSACA